MNLREIKFRRHAETGEAANSQPAEKPAHAAVIINADDLGRDPRTTDRILDCFLCDTVSSASAMVFMEDSERAAERAQEHGLDTGLHLNFTTPFSGNGAKATLVEHQQRLSCFLRLTNRARILYRSDLANSFDYVVRSQFDEFHRIYQHPARRVDGHHHMHLAANVLRQGLIPLHTVVRRNYTFLESKKWVINRLYRRIQDKRLARNYQITDYYFDILPLDPSRLQYIFRLGAAANVEIETHPACDEEYDFHVSGKLASCLNGVAVSRGYVLRICHNGVPRPATPLRSLVDQRP